MSDQSRTYPPPQPSPSRGEGATVIDLDEAPSDPPPLAGEGDRPQDGGGGIIVDETPGAIIDEDADAASALPKRAVRNAGGSITLPLRYPVELQIRSARGVRSERFAQLVLHRLTGGDLMAISAASNEARPVVLLARAARLREPVARALIERMDGADMVDATKVIDSFFGPGQTTGR